LTYTNGAIATDCGVSQQKVQYRSTVLQVICDSSNSSSSFQPTLISSNDSCTAIFVWRSIYGCPVCSEQDYLTTQTSCIDGMQSLVEVKRNPACNGPINKRIQETACSETLQFPLIAVLIGTVLFAALLVLVVILIVRNRRMSHRYNRLLAAEKENEAGSEERGNDFEMSTTNDPHSNRLSLSD